jgi:hypothetical protein
MQTDIFVLRIRGLMKNRIMTARERWFVKSLTVGVACLNLSCSTTTTRRSSLTPASDAKSGHGLRVDLPSFATIEELKAYGKPGEGVESYHTFEDGDSKVVVIVTGWGSGAVRDGISIYAYDSLTHRWEPAALWDTKARGVRVEFEKNVGVVRVLSKNGENIFSLSVSALSAKKTYDW